MKTARCKLRSVSPYSQSKHYTVEKLPGELPADYEKRTWRHRMHCDQDGTVIIPPMAFANCIKGAAKFLSEKIPGKRNMTWTKHFEAGILVAEPLALPITRDDVEGDWQFVPSDGIPGSGKRVDKCFPLIPEWSGEVTFYILDDLITQDVFERHLKTAGSLVGLGRFRPANRGYYGRFVVEGVTWQDA